MTYPRWNRCPNTSGNRPDDKEEPVQVWRRLACCKVDDDVGAHQETANVVHCQRLERQTTLERRLGEALGEASQNGVTRRYVFLDDSNFLITLLRREMGGKRYARLKSHFWLRASIASGLSAAIQAKNRLVWAERREAKRSIRGEPLRDEIW
jgi:hypothetical protein